MSALIAPTHEETRYLATPAARTTTRPRSRPELRTPVRPGTRRRQSERRKSTAPSLLNAVAVQLAQFVVIAGMIGAASSLAGQVALEQSRRDQLVATSRTRQALRAESDVRRQIETLTNREAIAKWAVQHGMEIPVVVRTSHENAEPAAR